MTRIKYIASFLMIAILISSTALAHFSDDPYIGEAITLTADRLETAQKKGGGPLAGTWPKEEDYTGSIIAGMAAAYQRTCDERYRTSAERGGGYIQGLLYSVGLSGDEAFALSWLSEIADDPTNNTWRDTLIEFYSMVESYPTSDYIAWFETGAEDSSAVFYLSHLLIAAYYVDATDKVLFRDSLPGFLAQVDDGSAYPVMALGAATWALAQTGPLDSTPVDSGGGKPNWDLVTLADLPGLVSSHQVSELDDPNWAGSFYWEFSNIWENRGFTEPTIYSALALIAAQKADPGINYDTQILAAKHALFNGIEPDGIVYEHIWGDSSDDYLYAGEMLTGLGDLVIDGDFDLDDVVTGGDLLTIADNWLSLCSGDCLCNRVDLDNNGTIDLVDFAILAKNWLRSDLIM